MPTLLATSPLAATRSQPTITASTAPPAISPAAAESTISSCGMLELGELVHGQPRALEQRPRLGGEHVVEPPALGELGDHGERRAAAGRGERARVAVGQDPPARWRADRRRGPRSRRWRPPPRRGCAGRASSARRRRSPLPGRATGRPRAPDRRPQARLTAVGRASRRSVAGRVERLAARVRARARGRCRKPRRRRSAARRGSPGGGSRAATSSALAELELALAPRERGLVDRPQRRRRRSAARRRSRVTRGSRRPWADAIPRPRGYAVAAGPGPRKGA